MEVSCKSPRAIGSRLGGGAPAGTGPGLLSMLFLNVSVWEVLPAQVRVAAAPHGDPLQCAFVSTSADRPARGTAAAGVVVAAPWPPRTCIWAEIVLLCKAEGGFCRSESFLFESGDLG